MLPIINTPGLPVLMCGNVAPLGLWDFWRLVMS